MFDYRAAFSRNLGWVTEEEQEVLRSRRIAIPGMGGVGGSHLLTLSRLGVGHFHISDFDSFELANFNRQAGAFVSTIGKPKIEVLAAMAQDINPESEVRLFDQGVNADNVEAFLDGVDLYVDALDFFAFEARRLVFATCQKRGIPAVTAAPLGMGSAFLCFMPGGMSFEEYFQLEGQSEEEQALRLMLGLSPAMLQMKYLVDDSRVDFNARRGPSTPMACEICAGLLTTQALKILLNRGDVVTAPRGLHFDAYRNRLARTWRPGGNGNPLQQLGLKIARKRVLAKMGQGGESSPNDPLPDRPLYRVLDAARWAPSGDNTQVWRFEVKSDDHFLVHGEDTRDWCVYDLDGHASQLALGSLQETIAIAAGQDGLSASFDLEFDAEDTEGRHPRLSVRLTGSSEDYLPQLRPFIRTRVTQRRPFKRLPLPESHKASLAEVLGEGYRVVWLEGPQRTAMARLLFRSAYIRLTTEEGYEVHRRTIDWGKRFSDTMIPEQAVGVDWATLRIMQWALGSWQRVRFLNRFFAGTWLPRIQMDFLTGLGCGAHFVILADNPPDTVADYLEGGRAVQRFWLEATRLNLQFQPEMTPLIFSRYHRDEREFSGNEKARRRAGEVNAELAALAGLSSDEFAAVYMGRLGFGATPTSRSTRLPVNELLHSAAE